MSAINLKDWEKEFRSFAETEESAPPGALSAKVLNTARRLLNPSPLAVFKKLGWIHLLAGAATLTVCPQFGVGPIGGGHGWMGMVMGYGSVACGVFCGAIFLGFTALVSAFALQPEEFRVVRKFGAGLYTALALASWLVLMTIGTYSDSHMMDASPQFILSWLAAGVMGAVLLSRAGFRVRLGER